MMTIEQAGDIFAITTAKEPRSIRTTYISGAYWMRAMMLQMMRDASMDFKDEPKEVIDQFCDKIYEQLKEIEK